MSLPCQALYFFHARNDVRPEQQTGTSAKHVGYERRKNFCTSFELVGQPLAAASYVVAVSYPRKAVFPFVQTPEILRDPEKFPTPRPLPALFPSF